MIFCLSAGAGLEQSRLSRLLMADWVTLFSEQLSADLQKIGREAYTRLSEPIPTTNSMPSRETICETNVSFDPEAHPVTSASQALLHFPV